MKKRDQIRLAPVEGVIMQCGDEKLTISVDQGFVEDRPRVRIVFSLPAQTAWLQLFMSEKNFAHVQQVINTSAKVGLA